MIRDSIVIRRVLAIIGAVLFVDAFKTFVNIGQFGPWIMLIAGVVLIALSLPRNS